MALAAPPVSQVLRLRQLVSSVLQGAPAFTCRATLWAVAGGLFFVTPSHAQETRADVIAAQQAEKAKDLHPYQPGAVERSIEDFRRRALEQPNGFFPFFASVYSGGGFTLGAGYRHMYAEATQWYVRGLYSLKNYKLIEAGTISNKHLGGRLSLAANGGWRDATQVGFFGLGMDSSQVDRANFRITQTFADGLATWKPIPFVVLTGRLGYEDYDQRSPQGSYPPVSEIYSPVTAPGIDAEPTYVHSAGIAGIDTRTSPGYSRTGAYYGIALHDYHDVDDTYSFNRADVDLVQHIPILRETWVLSLRGRVQTTLGDDDLVPFFLLPSLGSGSTLRAYQSWRFRDRHSILTSAEWRWIPNRLGMDMALFFDAGKVTRTRDGLDFKRLKTDWGIGARFHAPALTFLRIDAAHGAEGWNIVFAGDAAF
jgi:hypothetical protein